jgi:hypothetical protein
MIKKALFYTRFGCFGPQQGRNMPPTWHPMALTSPNLPQDGLAWPQLGPKTASTWPKPAAQASTAAILARKLALTENSVFYRVVWPFWASSCPVGASSTLSTCLQHRAPTWPKHCPHTGPTWPTMAQHSPNMPTCPQDVPVWRCLAIAGLCKSLQHCRSAAASAADLPQNPSPW